MTSSTTSGPVRLHGLDALRAAALGLGIVLHSLRPFAPGGFWLVSDSITSGAVGGPLTAIHLIRMALFITLAGYFGRMVLHRRGARSYLPDRTLRILLPLPAFWPVAVLHDGARGGPRGAPAVARRTVVRAGRRGARRAGRRAARGGAVPWCATR